MIIPRDGESGKGGATPRKVGAQCIVDTTRRNNMNNHDNRLQTTCLLGQSLLNPVGVNICRGNVINPLVTLYSIQAKDGYIVVFKVEHLRIRCFACNSGPLASDARKAGKIPSKNVKWRCALRKVSPPQASYPISV
jgi:hypothetical protein